MPNVFSSGSASDFTVIDVDEDECGTEAEGPPQEEEPVPGESSSNMCMQSGVVHAKCMQEEDDDNPEEESPSPRPAMSSENGLLEGNEVSLQTEQEDNTEPTRSSLTTARQTLEQNPLYRGRRSRRRHRARVGDAEVSPPYAEEPSFPSTRAVHHFLSQRSVAGLQSYFQHINRRDEDVSPGQILSQRDGLGRTAIQHAAQIGDPDLLNEILLYSLYPSPLASYTTLDDGLPVPFESLDSLDRQEVLTVVTSGRMPEDTVSLRAKYCDHSVYQLLLTHHPFIERRAMIRRCFHLLIAYQNALKLRRLAIEECLIEVAASNPSAQYTASPSTSSSHHLARDVVYAIKELSDKEGLFFTLDECKEEDKPADEQRELQREVREMTYAVKDWIRRMEKREGILTDTTDVPLLNLVCEQGDLDLVMDILSASGSEVSSALLMQADPHGVRPIHCAITSRDPELFAFLLGQIGLTDEHSLPSLLRQCIYRGAWRCLRVLMTDSLYSQQPLLDDDFESLMEFATQTGYEHEFPSAFQKAMEEEADPVEFDGVFSNIEEVHPMATRIFTHPSCRYHLRIPEPTDIPVSQFRRLLEIPENSSRLTVLTSMEDGILRSNQFSALEWSEFSPPAPFADILRVHDWGYVCRLKAKVKQAVEMAQSTGDRLSMQTLDDDTPVTTESWNAALGAAGCVIAAVKAVCERECRNAFCAVRPPGHHLGTWGAAQYCYTDEDRAAGSQGFCLLNNVAIGAAYARYNYYDQNIRRIAIVDFDVHHGNGTEQIVRAVHPRQRTMRVPGSVHWSMDFVLDFEMPSWKVWRDETDAQELLFASIHGFDGDFYPGTGYGGCDTGPVIINVPLSKGTTSEQFRTLYVDRIIRPLIDFRPDLIFVSAGFDGHQRDHVNCEFTAYTERDFEWATQQLVGVANMCSEGRLVSVLEGGYNTQLGILSPFAQSVASHVRTLLETSPRFRCSSSSSSYLPLRYSPILTTSRDPAPHLPGSSRTSSSSSDLPPPSTRGETDGIPADDVIMIENEEEASSFSEVPQDESSSEDVKKSRKRRINGSEVDPPKDTGETKKLRKELDEEDELAEQTSSPD